MAIFLAKNGEKVVLTRYYNDKIVLLRPRMNSPAPGDAKNGIVNFCRTTGYRVENRFFKLKIFKKD